MKKIGVMKPDQIVQENLLKKDVVATVNYALVIDSSNTTSFRISALVFYLFFMICFSPFHVPIFV